MNELVSINAALYSKKLRNKPLVLKDPYTLKDGHFYTADLSVFGIKGIIYIKIENK